MANEQAFHWKANRPANDLEGINAAKGERYEKEEKKNRETGKKENEWKKRKNGKMSLFPNYAK